MTTSGWIYSLSDENDLWFGEDKLTHLFGAAASFCVVGFFWTMLFGVLIEAVEAVRYQAWAKRGFPRPWPFLTDKVSVKDLLYDLAGMLVMAVLT